MCVVLSWQITAIYEFRANLERGCFNQLANNHRRARRDRGPAVRHVRRVRLNDFNLLLIDAEGVARNLRKNRVGSLAHFGARSHHAHSAVASRLSSNLGCEVLFAGARETGAMKKRREAYSLPNHFPRIFRFESFALLVIPTQL